MMRNLVYVALAASAIFGALVGHIGWSIVSDHLNNLGGPLMGIAAIAALVLGVALVEFRESERSDYEKP